jgi:hypothetical protein
MADWQEQHDSLKGTVTDLAAKMDRVLEMLANQNQSQPPPVISEGTSNRDAANVTWPPFGLPPGYKPPVYVVNGAPPPASNVENQAEVAMGQPGATVTQESPEDNREAYHSPELINEEPKLSSAIPQLEEARQKFKAIEDRLKSLEGGVDSLDFADMCLVPDLVIPPKFKVPEFEKYKGLSCLRNHLIMYSRKWLLMPTMTS